MKETTPAKDKLSIAAAWLFYMQVNVTVLVQVSSELFGVMNLSPHPPCPHTLMLVSWGGLGVHNRIFF